MQATLIIAKRQLRSYFSGPVAYIVTCLFLLLIGVFFWPDFFLVKRATVRDLFQVVSLLTVFAAPAMTMGSLAEERGRGTLELLITMPIRDWQVIVGKFFAAFSLFAIMLAVTFVYPLSVSTLGNLDWGPVFTGYLALALQGAAMLSIGLLASSWTENQLIAFFIGIALCFAFWFIDRFVPFLPRGAASVFEWLSINYHFRSMIRGVIDTRNVLYFLSLIGLALALAFHSLERRRWSA
ncbi:MAG: ABC transporter permease subunit [Myxococcales bacterium]|nr:ABC transporter permease subunit [Myxococcales bacterium]MCB9708966.1 ABC transporter permease subunit [Myxococcales bacterium]